MKIVIARPTLDKIEAFSEASLINMIANTKGHQINYIPCIGSTIVHDARNHLVDGAYKVGFDAILMIDADMEFPADTLTKLIGHDKDICGTMYADRVKGKYINAFDYNPKNKQYYRTTKQPGTGLQEVSAVGAGVLFVKKAVFDKIRSPYFFYDVVYSEDINFCHRSRMAGFKIHCDTDLDIIHIGKHKFALKRS